MALLSTALSIGAVIGCGDDQEDGQGAGANAGHEETARHGLTAEQAGEVLVKIGDTTITAGEFADQLAAQSPYLQARYNSPERRREFLDNLVRFELLAKEAERRGHMDNPEVVRSAKQVMIDRMMADMFEEQGLASDVSEDDIRRYYDEHHDDFNKPEQVRASHILIKNRALAQRVLTEAQAHAEDVGFFRRSSEQYNEDPATRGRFGDLQFFSRPGEASTDEPPVPDAVRTAAFTIEQIGGIYPDLVESPEGFHILKLTGRRAALHRPLEEARRPIQNRLARELRDRRVEEFVTRLRHDAHVEIDESALAEIHVDIPEGGASPTVEHELPPTAPPTPAPAPAPTKAPTKAPAPTHPSPEGSP